MMILMDVRRLMEPLSIWEGTLWLLVPALAQWLILKRTKKGGARLFLLAPVCWVFSSIVGAVFAFVFVAFLVFGLFALLFQTDFLSTVVLESLKFAGMLLVSETVLSAFGRLGLCVAGWGLGWAVYSLPQCAGGDGYV